MAIDMRQFHQIFFEETAEHLATMEALLLAMDVAAPDDEQINAVFRAAHSIKGSAATFGFEDLAAVTHLLENLLDRVRKGQLALQPAMIDTFLAAGDVLKAMLAAHRGGGPVDAAAREAVCARLEALVQGAAAVPEGPSAMAPSVVAAPLNHYDIRFALPEGAPPGVADNLLAELADRGTVTAIERPSAGDPLGTWRLGLTTATSRGEVADLLEFVVRSDSLSIESGESAPPVGDSGEPEYAFHDDGAAHPGELPSVVVASEAPLTIEGDGYGFFVDLPPVPIAVPQADAAPVQVVVDAPRPTTVRGGESSIRVSVEKVDAMIDLAGELVITQAMLAQAAAALDPVAHERLLSGIAQLERNTREIQETVLSVRMLPMSLVFSRFPRLVHDLSQRLGKRVELTIQGEETELDRGLIERIADPLTHLVRNSLDHGIEMPALRTARGKPVDGRITLAARHEGGHIVIEVSDDGVGLDRARILAKARERGMAVSESMSDADVWELIFEAGFSTNEQVTDLSGRGVGMDVVKRNIESLGGRVEVDSSAGVGTRITVRLPLTLAILDVLSVAVGGETYLLPMGCVIESLQPNRSQLKSISGVDRLIRIRDEYLPLIVLREVFRIPQGVADLEQGVAMILEVGGSRAALFVDTMLGQHQVVIKSLETNYRKVPGVAGATILGDGRVAMILDVAALATMARAALPVAA